MSLITDKQLSFLTKFYDDTAISLMLPTHREGHAENVKIDKTNYQNLLNVATQKLIKHGWEQEAIKRSMREAYNLMYDEPFWRDLSDGVAVYIHGNETMVLTLPIHFEEMVYVDNHFYVKPLSPVLSGDGRFFILALSRNDVRFFEGRRYSLADVKISDLVPMEMEEQPAVAAANESLQFHTGTAGNTPIYHGHGGGKSRKEVDVNKYLQSVDQGLMKMLHDETAPMVLACVDELAEQYRSISNYPYILEKNISGNPEQVDRLLLHEQAWEMVADQFNAPMREQLDKFPMHQEQGQASTNINEVIKTAVEGRVAHLFTQNDVNSWGAYDANTHAIDPHPVQQFDSSCLLNLAVIHTLQNGGMTYNLDETRIPGEQAVAAAIFRY